MGKGGGGGTQTVVNTQDIPPFLRDQLIQTFGEVENFRPRSDTVASVANLTADQRAFQQGIRNLANNTPAGIATAEQTFRDVARSQQIDQGNLQNLLGQNVQFDNPLAGGSGINTDILQGLTQARTTPFLQQQLDTAIQGAVDQATSQYALGGRLGSDSFAGALGSGVASAAAPILNQAAQADANRQLQAAQALADAQRASGALALQGAQTDATLQVQELGRLSDVERSIIDAERARGQLQLSGAETDASLQAQERARQLQALQSVADAEQASSALRLSGRETDAQFAQQDLQRQLDAARSLANVQQTETAQALQAASQLPQFQGLQLQWLGALGDIGAQNQALVQAQFNRQAQVNAAQNQANQQRINNLLAAIGSRGQALPGGTSTQTSPGRSPLAGGLGGALSGAALGSQIGAVGGPLGALVGGGLGLLGLI